MSKDFYDSNDSENFEIIDLNNAPEKENKTVETQWVDTPNYQYGNQSGTPQQFIDFEHPANAAPAPKKSAYGGSFAPYNSKAGKNSSPYLRNEPQQVYAEPKKIKRKSKLGRKLVALFLVLAVIFAVCVGGIYLLVDNSGYQKEKLSKNEYVSSNALMSDGKITNILLMGVDGTDSSDSLRSDSMILLSIDKKHEKIKLTSFMRDSWVPIPQTDSDGSHYEKHAKLNAAFNYGGAQLVCDTVETNFGVDIDHYMLVNFTMFKDVIDALGGIDVEVTQKEAEFMNRTTHFDDFESGDSVHLTGEKALIYVRIRKLDSDYMRTFRQRKVITSIIQKALKSNPFELVDIFNTVMPNVITDMSSAQITALALKAPGILINKYPVVQLRIPTDELSWNDYEGNQSVVELDIPANAEYLQKFIYDDINAEADT